MGTPYAQYPYQALQGVGISLGSISDQLSSSSRGAAEVLGLTPDQDPINSALSGFRAEWEQSVNKLSQSIGDFGTLSGQIGQLAGGLDQALADAMRVGGSGGSGHRAGGPV